MVCIRRQRLKAIRAGVPVADANKATSTEELIKLMREKDERSKRLTPKN